MTSHNNTYIGVGICNDYLKIMDNILKSQFFSTENTKVFFEYYIKIITRVQECRDLLWSLIESIDIEHSVPESLGAGLEDIIDGEKQLHLENVYLLDIIENYANEWRIKYDDVSKRQHAVILSKLNNQLEQYRENEKHIECDEKLNVFFYTHQEKKNKHDIEMTLKKIDYFIAMFQDPLDKETLSNKLAELAVPFPDPYNV